MALMTANGGGPNNSGLQAPPSRANSLKSQTSSNQLLYSPRPPMADRMPSSTGSTLSNNNFDHNGTGTGTSTPVATNSIVNKQATASSSLYQNCRTILDRLDRVPGFSQQFLDVDDNDDDGDRQPLSTTPRLDTTSGTPMATAPRIVSEDPVSRSLHCLRLGSSLCYLFNQLGLDHQLDVNPLATMSNLKACQRGTAHFIMACKQDLSWPDTDLFAIHELYGQDTNGVVKVINTVTKMLDLLEDRGVLLEPREPDPSVEELQRPTDERSKVVKEILDSERKYVQDLEVLQDYQRQLQANDVLTQDQIHHLFLNLNALCDFQRRFLIGVEANASRPAQDQRFGHLFLQMEDHFSVYQPYCANLTAAQDLAIAENASLSQLSHVLDPVSELAPLLIKPVQRICKYPLLLSTLLKNTPQTMPHHAELQEGLASIMRVTDRVNETKRKEDNKQAVLDLSRRVEDWKGHDIGSFGELLLQETFFVIKNESEREYNVYLFERIILCCKDNGGGASGSGSSKKSSKSNSIAKKPTSRKPSTLQLKGRIFVNNVTGATPYVRQGQYLLEVRWRGDVAEEAFTIKCRTDELLKQWQKGITKAVEESQQRRRLHQLSASRRSDNLRGGNGLYSPMSTFPQTPNTEAGSIHSFSSIPGAGSTQDGSSSPYPFMNSAIPNFPPGAQINGFDEEFDESTYEISESGRSTPSTMARRGMGTSSTRSLPSTDYYNGGGGSMHLSSSKPRAHTEDSGSAVINQWRTQTPNSINLPRGASLVSNGSTTDHQSLRSSSSSRHLREKHSIEHGGGGVSPAMSSHYRFATTNGDDHRAVPGLPRHTSHGNVPLVGSTSNGQQSQQQLHGSEAPMMLRNRSQSSPNVYQQPQFASNSTSSTPQLPDKDWPQTHPSQHQQQPYLQSQNSSSQSPSHPFAYLGGTHSHNSINGGSRQMLHKGSATNSGGTLASASSASSINGGQKRFSNSSAATDRSSATSAHSSYMTSQQQQQQQQHVASQQQQAYDGLYVNGSTTKGSQSQNGSSSSSAVRVKVTFGEDTFVIVVLNTCSYRELNDKVLKKIRLCGRTLQDESSLRLRYQDEDGDRILITSEEDVVMAFEAVKLGGPGAAGGGGGGIAQAGTLVLFASADGHN
ncbi:Guanine nucleotide exchange factor for Cdc42p [Microbotryomycetes sp. JL221]|nr:Guanine nucleotide exchange factor for Cdc42p [Microbotryomycetes sp. JL221]